MADEKSGGTTQNPVPTPTGWSEPDLATYVNQLSLSTDAQAVYLTFYQATSAIGQPAIGPVSPGPPQSEMQWTYPVPVNIRPVARLVVTPQTLLAMIRALQQLSKHLEEHQKRAAGSSGAASNE